MSVGIWLRKEAECHPHAADAALAAGLLVVALMVRNNGVRVSDSMSVSALVVEALVFFALTFRTARPVLVLFLTSDGSLLVMALDRTWTPVTLAVVAAGLPAAARTDRRFAVKMTLIFGPLMVLGTALCSGDWEDPKNLSLLGWIGWSAAPGGCLHSRPPHVAGA